MDFRLQRLLFGVIGAVLVTVAVLIRLNFSQGGGDFLASSLLRVGVLLCLLWLALPGLESLYKAFPKWAWIVALLILVVGALQRNLLIVFGAMILALGFLQGVKYFLPSMKREKSNAGARATHRGGGKVVEGSVVESKKSNNE